jgi:hypothetical protein
MRDSANRSLEPPKVGVRRQDVAVIGAATEGVPQNQRGTAAEQQRGVGVAAAAKRGKRLLVLTD